MKTCIRLIFLAVLLAVPSVVLAQEIILDEGPNGSLVMRQVPTRATGNYDYAPPVEYTRPSFRYEQGRPYYTERYGDTYVREYRYSRRSPSLLTVFVETLLRPDRCTYGRAYSGSYGRNQLWRSQQYECRRNWRR